MNCLSLFIIKYKFVNALITIAKTQLASLFITICHHLEALDNPLA